MPAFERPWEEYTLADARKEFPQSDDPHLEYLKHMARFHEGEVALAWERSQPEQGKAEGRARQACLVISSLPIVHDLFNDHSWCNE